MTGLELTSMWNTLSTVPLRKVAFIGTIPDGSLDTYIGTGGYVITDVSAGKDYAYDMVLQPDGRITLVGEANWDIALARYK